MSKNTATATLSNRQYDPPTFSSQAERGMSQQKKGPRINFNLTSPNDVDTWSVRGVKSWRPPHPAYLVSKLGIGHVLPHPMEIRSQSPHHI